MSTSYVLMCLLIVVASDEQTPRKNLSFSLAILKYVLQRSVLIKPSEMPVEDD